MVLKFLNILDIELDRVRSTVQPSYLTSDMKLALGCCCLVAEARQCDFVSHTLQESVH